ncbi:MAG: vWA domain-containing protein [Bacteroidota bacterium]|nr:vWA domain-containing protein [Bacteroidota bacterium]
MFIGFISITLGGSWLLFFFLGLIFIFLAVLFYKYTIPPLSTLKKLFLSVVRSIVLTLLLFVIFEPIISFINIETKQPTVAVLIDNSQSITVSEKSAQQITELSKMLDSKTIVNNLKGTEVTYYTFSSGAKKLKEYFSGAVDYSGEVTDIAAALKSLKEDTKNENLQAVVLISDGNYNQGKNPVYLAEGLNVPVYTIGIGDTSEQRDVLVADVQTNNIAYAQTRIPVDVTVKWSACSGENAEVVLSEGKNILDKKTINLSRDGAETRIRMFFEAEEEGTKKITVSVSNITGELTEKNNYKSVFIKVLKSKLKVLILGGSPSADITAVKQALSEDQHIESLSFTQKKIGEFYTDGREKTFSQSSLDSADCIVMINYPTIITSKEIIEQIKKTIGDQRKSIFFINAKDVDYTKLRLIEEFLPFVWSNVNSNELLVFAEIHEKNKNHPLLNIETAATYEGWSQMPPVFKTQTQFRSKIESDILATIKIQNIQIDEPLILTRNINRYKSAAITGYGLWRWRLLAQGNSQTERLYASFLTNIIKWLTTKEDEKKVRVVPVKEVFATTDPIEFTAQVYDDQYRQLDDAEVNVTLESEKEQTKIILESVGNGRYEGAFINLPEGDYVYSANAVTKGRVAGEDRGKFSVGKMNIEYLDTKLNKQLLDQVAFKTGGMYVDIENADKIIKALSSKKYEQQEITTITKVQIWNWEYIALLIVILFSIEWFIRKRNGML